MVAGGEIGVFRGLTAVNVDAKGRMALPRRCRDQYEGEWLVTIDPIDPCLLLYPLENWEKIEQKLIQLSSFNAENRRIQRLLVGHATEIMPDGQGRILVPPLLREYASVQKILMMVGQGNKFELWSEEKWESARGEWLNTPTDDASASLEELAL